MESSRSTILITLTYVVLAAVAVCDIICGVLSIIILADGVKDNAFLFITSISFVAILIILVSLLHKYFNRGEVTSNVANLVTFGTLWLIGLCLCIGSTMQVKNATCHHSSTTANSCVPIYALLPVAYLSFILTFIGFGISWTDKYPGAIEVQPRYKITKAPSSHFAAWAHPLDEELAYKLPPRPAKPAPFRQTREPTSMRRHDHWTEIRL